MPDELRDIFRPASEPDFDAHHNQLQQFFMWLTNPVALPGRFPDTTKDSRQVVGAWAVASVFLWNSRYDEHRMRAERWNSIFTRFLGTGFLGALAAGGLDGEYDGLEDIFGPAVTGAGRTFLPSVLENKRDKAIRNRDLLKQIASKYGITL